MLNNVQVVNNSIVVPFRMSSNTDWITAPNLLKNLSEHQIVVWRSYVYLIGGFDGASASNTVYKANILSSGHSAWEIQNALPDSLRNSAIVATSTKLYVMGGRNNSTPSNKIYVTNLNDNGTIGTWSLASNTLPQALQGLKAQVINGYVYLVGGTNQTNNSTAINTVFYAKIDLDGVIGNFVATTSLPEARNGHSIVNYDNKIYVIGGYDNSNTKKRTVYYAGLNNDGTCSTWQNASPLPTSLSNHSSSCSHGIVTVIGGEDSLTTTNKFYYTNIDASPTLNWILSDKYLYDRSKNGSVFETPGQIIYSGGTNLSGSSINSNRYVSFNYDTTKVKRSSFVSDPYIIGNPKTFQKLTYTLTSNSTTDSVELLYRLAGINKIWGSWISGGKTNPVFINQTSSFIQYMVRFFANGISNLSLDDITLTVSGYTQLCGSLNAMDTLKLSNSPFWATCDIQFTAGTHVIEAGVKIEFSPNIMLEIGQANMRFNGNSANPIILTSYDTLRTQWNGLYFNSNSKTGVTSNLTFTNISYAGNGTNNANLYCNNTTQPTILNSNFRNSIGHGIRLETSNISITSTNINNNSKSGLFLNVSSPILSSVNISNNIYAGLYYASAGITPTFTNCLSANNLYGIYSPSADNSFALSSPTALVLTNNNTDIVVEGGTITANRTWSYFPNGYAVLGDVTIAKSGSSIRLTIAPGTKIKVAKDKGIFIGGNSTTGGEIYANGKADSLITFTALNDTIGGWKGLCFNDGSDYSSTSSLRYCLIEKGNEYNIYSLNSNEPRIQFSTVRNSVTYGIKSENSNLSIEESTISKAITGIYLNNASPSIVLLNIDSVTNGLYINSNSIPTFYMCNLTNSLYGIYYPTPDNSIPTFGNITFTNIKYSIAINGGDIASDRIWSYNPNNFVILGNIRIMKVNNKCRLTIQPGCTLKFSKNMQLQIGTGYISGIGYCYGELYAAGKPDSIITFTALNDSIGGWNGLFFHDYSDNIAGMYSLLKNAKVEKGSQYNIYSNNTSMPFIDSCTIINSADKGMLLESSPLTIVNSEISNNLGIGVYSNNSQLKLSNLKFNNNTNYGLLYNSAHYVDTLKNLQFTGNLMNGVIINGGDISENRSWSVYGDKPYIILGNIRIIKPNIKCRLTLQPGCTLRFAKTFNVQISGYISGLGYCYGELYAVGKQDSIITISALNDSIGGWNGLYFNDYCDNIAGMLSLLKYTKVEKGSQYNIYCNYTSVPIIDSCTIVNSADKGILAEYSPLTIINSEINNNLGIGIYSFNSQLKLSNLKFNNNTNYGLLYNSALYVDTLKNLQFTGNLLDGVVINGGDISENRSWSLFGDKPYIIIGSMRVMKNPSSCRFEIKPGCTLKFAKNTNIQISTYSSGYYYGELYTLGKPDSIITFTALNDSIGGWNGLYFHDYSDNISGMSSLIKYTKVEKASQYNIYCSNTNQPTIERSIIEKSGSYGLWFEGATATNIVKNTKVINNVGYGIYLTSSSNPTIGNNLSSSCDFYNNGYHIYNNNALKYNMMCNYWGSMDSAVIDSKIYDKIDNSGLGKIYYQPFSSIPTTSESPILLSGRLLYNSNISKPIKNAIMVIKNYGDTTIASTTTNSSGNFTFSPFTSGSYKLNITPLDPWSGVNSTDALMILNHFAQVTPLSGMNLSAADVNYSRTVNGTDALFVMKRYSGMITSFPAGDYLFHTDTVIINGNLVTNNLKMICVGDVNASNIPAKKSTSSLGLVYEGSLQIESFTEFDFPVKLKSGMQVGAISLGFYFPKNYLEIIDAKLVNGESGFAWTAIDSLFRMSWCSTSALNIISDSTVVVLKMKTKDLANLSTGIALEKYENCEFADPWGIPNDWEDVSIPEIINIETNIKENEIKHKLSVYPNPVNGKSVISFSLEKSGNIRIELVDILGKHIQELTNNSYSIGNHKLDLQVSQLSSGIYFLKFTNSNDNLNISDIIKLVVSY